MEKSISGYSIHQAYAWMIKEMKEAGNLEGLRNTSNFIDLYLLCDEPELFDDCIRMFRETGFVVGYQECAPGGNPNQVQTQVIDTIIKGDKKWATNYLAVYDFPWGDELVRGSQKGTKKESVDVARAASQLENRDVFVLIGKSPDGFPRCSAQCLYKPSPKQTPGLYKFIW